MQECAKEIERRGGHPIPVTMDHGVDAEVDTLFEKIRIEQQGQLDLLVNNAYAGVSTILQSVGKKFWETDPTTSWDIVNGVGLRGHYVCTVLAARMMVPRGKGLIVTVSSIGGHKYIAWEKVYCIYIKIIFVGTGARRSCMTTFSMCATMLAKLDVTEWLLTVPLSFVSLV